MEKPRPYQKIFQADFLRFQRDEGRQYLSGDFLDLTLAQLAQMEGAVGGAQQAADLAAKMLEHAAYLAVFALGKRHGQPAVAAFVAVYAGLDVAVMDAIRHDAFFHI